MSSKLKPVHMRAYKAPTRSWEGTLCGRPLGDLTFTTNTRYVTCRTCRRSLRTKPEYREARP